MSKKNSLHVAETHDWLISGVPQSVRDLAKRHSEASDLSLGGWLTEAIVAHAKSDRNGLPSNPLAFQATVEFEQLAQKIESLDSRLKHIEKRTANLRQKTPSPSQ